MMVKVPVAVLLFLSVTSPARAGASALDQESTGIVSTQRHADQFAHAFTKLTGVAIAPMAGMAALGAWTYVATPISSRPALPWYDQPWFWGTLAALLVLEWLGHRVPVVRTFAKAIKVKEDQLAGLVSIIVLANECGLAAQHPFGSIVATGGHMLHPVAGTSSFVLAAAVSPPMSAAYISGFLVAVLIGSTVWLAAHSVSVLSLLVPFQLVEWLLKATRIALLAILVLCATLNPVAGLVASAIIFLLALVIAGWSFRLMVFGSVFASDILFMRWLRTMAHGQDIRAFSGGGVPGVPIRSYGALQVDGREVLFVYRTLPLLVPRRVPIPGTLVVGTGLVSPVILRQDRTRTVQVCRLPPRYRAAPQSVANALGGLPTADVSVSRGFRAALAWVKDQLRQNPPDATPQPPPAMSI